MITLPTKISVLTCCYNAENFIEEAVETILHQSYKEFEYVVVDDGSTDNTLPILKRYAARDKRIVLIEKEHSGLTPSLNVGLHQARGEWIARLDADDVAMPDRLFNQLDFVEHNGGIVLLGGSCVEVDENRSAVKKHIYPQEHNALMKRLEKFQPFFPHSSAFFKKELVMMMGGYNPKFTGAQDLDLFLRIGETALIACLRVPVVELRKHPQMISNTSQGRWQQILGMCARICHFRRKSNLSDPSTMEGDVWREFVEWVERTMEDEGYFQYRECWESLRNIWYSNPKVKKICSTAALLKQLMHDGLAHKAFWKHLTKGSLVRQLAEESRKIL